jgi:tetratricopeptide (TPR) repeat protein
MRVIIIFAIALFSVALLSCGDVTSSKTGDSKQSDLLTIDSLTFLIQKNPHDAKLYAQRSKLYADSGKLNNAVKDMIFANKIDSLNPEYYIVLSDLYLSLGKSEVVNDLLIKANHLIPNNKDILFRLGRLYFYIQDYKKAVEYLNKTIEVDNYFAEAWFVKGLVYSELGKRQRDKVFSVCSGAKSRLLQCIYSTRVIVFRKARFTGFKLLQQCS